MVGARFAASRRLKAARLVFSLAGRYSDCPQPFGQHPYLFRAGSFGGLLSSPFAGHSLCASTFRAAVRISPDRLGRDPKHPIRLPDCLSWSFPRHGQFEITKKGFEPLAVC
jgi:hypothetical protein